MTVYVTQATSKHNLAQATRFGELAALLPERTNITLSPQPVVRELQVQLKNFSDDDHLLLLGDPLAIALAFSAAAAANGGRVSVLKWDKGLDNYYQVKVDVYDRRAPEELPC